MNSTSTRAADPPAVSRSNRGFGVSDAMAVIAGTAFAVSGGSKYVVIFVQQTIWLFQTILAYNSPPYLGRPRLWREQVSMCWSDVLWYLFQIVEVLVLSATVTFLLARIRPPRPPFRDMVKQPGTVAGLAIVFGYFWVTGWLHRLFFGRIIDACATAIAVGASVVIAWCILALSRQWTSESSWVDWLGRLNGAAAIAAALLAYAQFGV